jgi:hypothetical protein
VSAIAVYIDWLVYKIIFHCFSLSLFRTLCRFYESKMCWPCLVILYSYSFLYTKIHPDIIDYMKLICIMIWPRPWPKITCIRNSSFICLLFQEHFNFIGTDDQLGPVLLSVKSESLASQEQTRLLLRLRTGTTHELVPSTCATSAPHHMAKVS